MNNNVSNKINIASIFTEQQDYVEKKLILENNEIKFLSETEIQKLKSEGHEIVDSLKVISGILKQELTDNIVIETKSDRLVQNCIANCQWIESKIEKHNEKIEENFFKRVLNNVLYFLSFGNYQLEYESIFEVPQDRISLFLKLAPRLPTAAIIHQLPKISEQDKSTLLSELIDKHESGITNADKSKLLQSLSAKNGSHPLVQYLIIQELKTEVTRNSNVSSDHLQTLEYIDSLKKFIPHENLLKVLVFIRENRGLMEAGKIGVESERRHSVRKIEVGAMHLEYDAKSGDILIKVKDVLGKGSFKVVKKGLIVSPTQLSMTAVAKQSMIGKDKETAERELVMLEAAKGLPHVVQLHHVSVYKTKKTGKDIQRAMFPYYNMGELEDHLNSSKINRKDKLRLFSEILTGLIGLHERGIIHRDIKPANIFLHETIENGQKVIHAYVGDLGLACFQSDSKACEEVVGTPLYMPPDIIANGAADYNMDAWALGVMMQQFFTGNKKVAHLTTATTRNDVKVMGNQLDNKSTNPPPKNHNSVEYILWSLMQPDKAKRMKLPDALTRVQNLMAAL